METEFVMVPRDQLDILMLQMQRAEQFCRKARARTKDDDIVTAEPTEFYSGASGYAGATLRHAINSIQLHYE
jgi:hypothetical protein